jgi:4-alpha-glucanotransferase
MFDSLTLAEDERIAGVLVPVFALRRDDDLGIGDVGGLRELVDWAAEAGLGFIQLLPVNEMGGDHSPYNAISSVALEPLTLDVSPGAVRELTEADHARALAGTDLAALRAGDVDYPAVRRLKSDLLWRAFEAFREQHYWKGTGREAEFLEFCSAERHWLYDYCRFRLLLDMEGGREDWETWPEDYRDADRAWAFLDRLLETEREKTEHQLAFYAYVQFVAQEQWDAVAAHARARGVKLMGDVPYGVSRCSCDVFANRRLFNLEWFGGAPPEKNFKDDEFTVRWGQNWGIPLYRWDVMAEDGYAWWRQRIGKLCRFFDIFRIDHALGFYRIYGFPWRPDRNGEFLFLTPDEARARTGGRLPGFHPGPDETGEMRQRNRAQGERYLSMIREAADGSAVVAEDLGFVPDYVPESLLSIGLAGMKVPQWECGDDGEFRDARTYPWLTLATYATHDHEPVKTQWNRARDLALRHGNDGEGWEPARFLERLGRFAGVDLPGGPFPEYDDRIRERLLRALFAARSRYASVMITDLFGLEERFNVPGVLSDRNWSHRLPMSVAALRQQEPWAGMSARMKNLLKETGRLPVPG